MQVVIPNINNKIGQIPGETYDGRLVDSNGNGLYGGFFFVDLDSNILSIEFYTDADGYFHFTVPDHNWQNINLNFYSTPEYEPIVKTFDELVHDQPVVLKKKNSSGINILDLVQYGGIALGVLSLVNDSGKVGEAQTKKNGWVLPAVIVGGGVALYLAFKYKPRPEQKQYLEEAKNRLDELASQGIVPSLSIAQFSSLVVQLVKAFAKCGTEEDIIYNVFRKLNNEADLIFLIIKYDIAKYDGCFEGSFPSWNVHFVLSESIAADMTPSEIRNINSILSAKRINFSF